MPADILSSNPPALSATSDIPQIDPAAVAVPETPASSTPETPAAPSVPEVPTVPVAPAPATEPSAEGPMWARERIGTYAARAREADARAARLESLAQQQSEQIKALIEKTNTTTVPVSNVPTQAGTEFADPRPSRETFADPESYETALVAWAGQKAAHEATAIMAKRDQEQAEQRAENERRAAEAKAAEDARIEQDKRATEITTKWEERKAKAVEKYPDFLESIQNEDLMIPAGSYVAHAVLTQENGPEIGYYLSKNLEEARRIANMVVPGQFIPAGNPNAGMPQPDFIAQAREIGRIEAKLEAQAATVATSVPTVDTSTTEAAITNALAPTATTSAPTTIAILPTPPSPLTGASAEATQRSGDDLSMEEYAARRMPQLRAERRPGRSIN